MERSQEQELIDKYTQDYKLDQQTKLKALELFQEFLSTQQNIKPVRFSPPFSKAHINFSPTNIYPPSILINRA